MFCDVDNIVFNKYIDFYIYNIKIVLIIIFFLNEIWSRFSLLLCFAGFISIVVF